MYIQGSNFANEIYHEIKLLNIHLKLGIIQIGDNPASNQYIRIKKKKLEEIGFHWEHIRLDDDVDESEFISAITSMSDDLNIHGIIVQLPIKANMLRHLDLIPHYKDVDGITSINQGRLYKGVDSVYIAPCTPLGIMHFLKQHNIEMSGKRIAIFGKSFLVGRPIAALLQAQGASVITINKSDPNPQDLSIKADIVISAIGIPHYITKNFIQTNALVIDVGVSVVNGITMGDVSPDVLEKTKFVTGCKGGIGPLTVAFLAYNLVQCYKFKSAL